MNALTVDSCQRMGILFDHLVSSCELVNSTRVQVQVTGVVPIIAIDKCDGVQVRLHPVTAKHADIGPMCKQRRCPDYGWKDAVDTLWYLYLTLS